jgi:hypothetical protein
MKIFLFLFVVVPALIVLLGIILPWLISAKSTLMVSVGIVILLIVLAGLYLLIYQMRGRDA